MRRFYIFGPPTKEYLRRLYFRCCLIFIGRAICVEPITVKSCSIKHKINSVFGFSVLLIFLLFHLCIISSKSISYQHIISCLSTSVLAHPNLFYISILCLLFFLFVRHCIISSQSILYQHFSCCSTSELRNSFMTVVPALLLRLETCAHL